ncbi:MAG TPA: AAA family ATPase, partial [Candidatus Angelobacter sp.]|nr:AAA family ATPase [Candidatus Angelobacter sp.]
RDERSERAMDATPDGAAVSHAHGPAVLRETHSGVIVLLGDRAYKVKKPVDLGFLDFTTVEARHRACLRELELNRRLSPDVYLDLAAVHASDGRVLDHLVVMRRMPEELRLSTMVQRGDDVEGHLRALARLIADFHAGAERGRRIAAEGGPEGLRRRWSDNLRESEGFRGRYLDEETFDEIARLALDYVDGRTALLAERAKAGLSVDGHGDLIADDIFCLPDHPRVLDCLDFSDRLRWVDVQDDVAFLAMDLERLGRPDLGERFLAWYDEFGGSPVVVSLRHHYMAYRAFVRTKVTCIRAAQGVPDSVGKAQALAALTLRHLRAGEPTLVLVGGAPGTGKSTLAAALADRLGAVLLSSDATRQDLADPGDPYRPEAKAAVYRALLARGRLALEHGESVVADATWGGTAVREAAAETASSSSSRLVRLECRLAPEIAAERAQARWTGGRSASDADAAVALRLAAERDPWPEAVPVDTVSAEAALHAALAVVLPA